MAPELDHVEVSRVDQRARRLPQDAHHVKLGEGVDAENIDDEMRTYEGKTFSLEDVLRELLVLAQEPYPTVETVCRATYSLSVSESR